MSKKVEELTELRMKLEFLEGECQNSGEKLRNKDEVMKAVDTELSSFKERVTSLTKENEVLEVKVLKWRHPSLYLVIISVCLSTHILADFVQKFHFLE